MAKVGTGSGHYTTGCKSCRTETRRMVISPALARTQLCQTRFRCQSSPPPALNFAVIWSGIPRCIALGDCIEVEFRHRTPLAALCAVQQLLVGQHKRHHRLDHWRAAYAHAGIVAALCDDVGRIAVAGDCFHGRED